MIIKRIVLSVLTILSFNSNSIAASLDYFTKYAHGNTNQLVMDHHFQQITHDFFGKQQDRYLKAKSEPTANTLIEVLHGPPDDIDLVQERYLVATACRYHSCPEKGFVLIDTKTDALAYALIHYSLDWSNKEAENRNGYLTVFLKKNTSEEFKQLTLERVHLWQTTFEGDKYHPALASLSPHIIYLN